MFEKFDLSNRQTEHEWLFLLASFTAKFEMVFALTQENAFSERFQINVNRKSIGYSKKWYQEFLK